MSGMFNSCFVPVIPTIMCSQTPAKGNERSGKCPETIHAAPYSVGAEASSWVLLDLPACGEGQCWSHVPSLCQMFPQTWSSPDQTSALLMSPGSSLPGTKPRSVWGHLCVPQLLFQPPNPHSLHVPARCHCCAAVTTPSQTPSPYFSLLPPRNTSTRPAAVFFPPAVLTGCVASARLWVGGRSEAERGRSGRSGRGIKPDLFLYCKVITRAFQSLICRKHPGAIGSFPEPGNNSSITHLLRQSPVNAHTWAHTGIHVLQNCQHVCPLLPAAPGTETGMGNLVGILVYSWEDLTTEPAG